MKELIFATHNPNKAEEIQEMLPEFAVQSLADIDFANEIPETGDTLEENALIKARTIFGKTNKACFADDTGLEVEALDGAPGVYSARYAGDEADPEKNMTKLLKELEGKSFRNAAFRTVIAYIDAAGKQQLFEGSVSGEILEERTGEGGFGYDPIFKPMGYDQSFAEMTPIQKNEISHRGRAVKRFVEFLRS